MFLLLQVFEINTQGLQRHLQHINECQVAGSDNSANMSTVLEVRFGHQQIVQQLLRVKRWRHDACKGCILPERTLTNLNTS